MALEDVLILVLNVDANPKVVAANVKLTLVEVLQGLVVLAMILLLGLRERLVGDLLLALQRWLRLIWLLLRFLQRKVSLLGMGLLLAQGVGQLVGTAHRRRPRMADHLLLLLLLVLLEWLMVQSV